MYFPGLGDICKYKWVISDASFAGLLDGFSSAGGFVIFLVGEYGNGCPLYWEAKKIRVVKSTLAAGTLAAAEAIDMAYCLRNNWQILYGKEEKLPVELYVYNRSLYDNVYCQKCVRKVKVWHSCSEGNDSEWLIEDVWVDLKAQLADVLTNKGVNYMKIASVFESGSLKC